MINFNDQLSTKKGYIGEDIIKKFLNGKNFVEKT